MPHKNTPNIFTSLNKYKLDYILLFITMSIYYGWLQWNKYIGDPDGFYHAKMALLLRQGTLLKTLPWMQFTTLKDSYTDHHLLYHLLLAPFTYLVNPLIGVKVATVFLTVLMALAFYYLLKRLHIIWPWLFVLMLITLNGLNFRLTLIKANSLSLIIIYLLIYALFYKKIKLIAVLGLIFVWSYGGWPLSIIIVFGYLLANKIYDYLHTNKLKLFWHQTIHTFHHQKKFTNSWKILSALLIGLILGIVINPYFPQNLYFYYQQIIQIGLVNQSGQFPVGGEWYGTSIMHIISSMPHVFVFAALAFIILFFNYEKISRKTWFGLILMLIFTLMTLKSRRYIEYLAPFTLLFTACAITDLYNFLNFHKIKQQWQKMPSYLKAYLIIVAFVFATMVMPSIYSKTLEVDSPKTRTADTLAASSTWLKEHAPVGAIVFHSDWDEWPMLFYHNDQNYYIVGLDPTFMENFDSELHSLYRNITTGGVSYQLSKQIKNNFSAQFILVERAGHQGLVDNLNKDTGSPMVYQDNEVNIYKIK